METKCPICLSNSKQIAELRSISIEEHKGFESLNVNCCISCYNYCFQGSAYNSKYDQDYKDVYTNYHVNQIFEFPERTSKNLIALEDIVQNRLINEKASILEVGSNRGDLLYLIKEKYPNVNILGIEPTIFNKKHVLVPTICSDFNSHLFSNKFDLIIIKHVLEHIKFPHRFLTELKHLLNDNGYIYIEVPDFEKSLDNCIDDFIPDHVSYFDENTIRYVVHYAGLSTLKLENRYFLHLIASNNGKKDCRFEKRRNIDHIIEKFKFYLKKREELVDIISHSKNIVFYGVSYYYLRIYQEVYNLLNTDNIFFYDDNYKEDIEPHFDVPRITNLEKTDLIVICSNNFQVQQKILNKIRQKNILTPVITPWSSIYYAK